MKRDIRILLHDIRSVYNVGAIFRTADAIGVTKIYLTGVSPTPLDRFGVPRSDFAKSALGSEHTVPWEYRKSASALVKKLKQEEFMVIALEQSETSLDYKHVTPSAKTLIILGNEVSGVPKSLQTRSDVIAEIPMRGLKESLNVSVSAGIALFRWFD